MQIDSCRQVRRMELDVEIKKIKIKGAQQLKNLVAFDVKFKSSGKRNMGGGGSLALVLDEFQTSVLECYGVE